MNNILYVVANRFPITVIGLGLLVAVILLQRKIEKDNKREKRGHKPQGGGK